jgi:hypothetical protein
VSKVQKLPTKLLMLGQDRLVASVASQKHDRCEQWMLPSAMIAVRGKSLGRQHRRDAQRAQDQLRKNNNAVLGNIKRGELFYVAELPDEDSCIKRLRLRTAALSECIEANLGGQCPLWVKSGHWIAAR